MIRTSLKALALKYNCSFTYEEKTFNLGECIRNVPHNVITLAKVNNSLKLKITCEFVYGTSPKPSYYTGNLTDNYIFRIEAEFNDSERFNDFYIISNSAIRFYLFNSSFQVKTKDKELKSYLKQNVILKRIYDESYKSAEISPMIEVEVKRNKVYFDINYQSFEINFEILEDVIRFIEELKQD